MDKFKGKYRTTTTRANFWDYGSNAPYFVTICTNNREHSFGKVVNGEMQLSEIGKIADECWRAIPDHFPFVQLHNHIVMPNHVHGIIIIDKPDIAENSHVGVETQNLASDIVEKNPQIAAETQNLASVLGVDSHGFEEITENPGKNKFGPQSRNLASIVRGFKVGVTKRAKLIDPLFAWQPRFHDHIIRDDRAYKTIAHYIENNPQKWQEDTFNGIKE